MKKFLALILFVILVCTLSACGGNSSDVSLGETDVVVETQDTETDVSAETQTVAWEDFLDEYETWVDQYIVFMKKYKESPSDLSLLADYADMMTEMADWTEKSQQVQDELENASPSEIAKYSARLAEIAAKLAKAAY